MRVLGGISLNCSKEVLTNYIIRACIMPQTHSLSALSFIGEFVALVDSGEVSASVSCAGYIL
jgi:hypothetical protein